MAKIELLPDETILKKGFASHLESKMKLRSGTGYLTNQRFMYYRSRLPWLLDGELTTLLFPRVMAIEIPLHSIASISRGKYGLNKNVLIIKTKMGQEHSLIMEKFEKWFSALSDALLTHQGMELVESAGQTWIPRKL